jgi:hypothetical protein
MASDKNPYPMRDLAAQLKAIGDQGHALAEKALKPAPITRTSVTAHRSRPVLSGRAPRDGVPAPVRFRTEHVLGVVVNRPSLGLTDDFCALCWSVRRIPTHGRLTPCGN